MRKAWPFTFNLIFFASSATVSPFVLLYYQGLGFSGAQIGILAGFGPLITLASAPLWTGLADATRRHRACMNAAILGGVAALVVFPFLDSFGEILPVSMLLSFFLAPIASFADSATMHMLAEERAQYGRIRLGGSLGYGVAAPIAGALVQQHGLRAAFWGSAVLFVLGLLVGQKLVHAEARAQARSGGGLREFLRNPRWPPFLALSLAGGLVLSALNTFFFPYMKELGATESTMGLALTIGTISEIPVLFYGDHLFRILKPYGLLLAAMALSGLRLVLFAAVATPGAVLWIQLINGLTFPAAWMAGVAYADANAPPGMNALAQGLFGATVMGLGMAGGGLMGGPLLEALGGRGLFLVFGVGILGAVAMVLLVTRFLPTRPKEPLPVAGPSSTPSPR
jgi:PPP family 3-phenylpropionic acid transporter